MSDLNQCLPPTQELLVWDGAGKRKKRGNDSTTNKGDSGAPYIQ